MCQRTEADFCGSHPSTFMAVTVQRKQRFSLILSKTQRQRSRRRSILAGLLLVWLTMDSTSASPALAFRSQTETMFDDGAASDVSGSHHPEHRGPLLASTSNLEKSHRLSRDRKAVKWPTATRALLRPGYEILSVLCAQELISGRRSHLP